MKTRKRVIVYGVRLEIDLHSFDISYVKGIFRVSTINLDVDPLLLPSQTSVNKSASDSPRNTP